MTQRVAGDLASRRAGARFLGTAHNHGTRALKTWQEHSWWFCLFCTGWLMLAGGCAQYGLVSDGTSLSFGRANSGRLVNPARLPVAGDGYVIPQRWRERALYYGTDESVSLIAYAARQVATHEPGSVLGVGDLSPKQGGPSTWHRSHQTGRDFDLLFYMKDEREQSLSPTTMHVCKIDALPRSRKAHASAIPCASARFDVARNWLLVRALLENPIAEVQWIFVHDLLKMALLEHAAEIGEPKALLLKASYVMWQPGDSLPHNDHLHVRIYCSPADRKMGCQDYGALRWTKKSRKFIQQRRIGLVAGG